MATWDILHVNSLEVEHSVPEADVLRALSEGRMSRDDCVRRPGDERWWRVYEVNEFRSAAPEQLLREEPLGDETPRLEEISLRELLADVEPAEGVARPRRPTSAPTSATPVKAPAPLPSPPDIVDIDRGIEEEGLPYLTRRRDEPEELDMTPMVDVAMQLILFFMVTSTMILQSCIQFPRPAPDDTSRAAPIPQKLDDLRNERITVKVKADNTIWVDDDKTPTKSSDLVAKLETVKRDRIAAGGIIISAEDPAWHETVVSVVDAANVANIAPIQMAAIKAAVKKPPARKRAIKN